MKKFSRRELFRGAGTAAVGATALAVGLTPAAKERMILAGSRVGKSLPGLYPEWTPTLYLSRSSVSPIWLRKFFDESLKQAGFSGGARYKAE